MATITRQGGVRRRGQGTDASRHHPRRRSSPCCSPPPTSISGLKLGTDLRDLDPGRGHLDGGAQVLRGLDHPGEQYRPDHRLGGGDAVGDHLRPARAWSWSAGGPASPIWLSVAVIAIGGILGVHVFGAAAARARDRSDLPYPGRRRRGRSAEGRRRRRRRRGEPRAASSMIVWSSLVVGRLRHPRPDQAGRGRGRAQLRLRRRRDDRLGQPVDGADRRRPSGRPGGRHRHARRPDHQLVRSRPLADRPRRRSAGARASRPSSATVFREKVRFIGAGTIGVAAIWTLLGSSARSSRGITSALAASARAAPAGRTASPLTERDIPIGIVGGGDPRSRWSRSACCCRPSRRAARSPPTPGLTLGAQPPLHPRRGVDHRRGHAATWPA